MGTRRIGNIDLQTGELMEGVPVWVGTKIRSPYGGRFFMSNQDAAEAIAKDPDMTRHAFRVFMYLCSRLDFENYIQVPQVEIAEELGMGKDKVSKAITLLASKQIVMRGPKLGRSSAFRLNPNYGWKGKVTQLRKAQAEHLKLIRNGQAETA